MRIENLTQTVPLPEGVTVEHTDGRLRVTGPLGNLERPVANPPFRLEIESEKVELICPLARRKEKALLGTWRAHLANMVKGVTEGFEYQLKVVFAHFPVKLTQKGTDIVIENFLGERFPRKSRLVGRTKAEIKDQLITLTGMDKEAVGQSAANLERATKIRGFDPRVFQDGCYIISKS